MAMVFAAGCVPISSNFRMSSSLPSGAAKEEDILDQVLHRPTKAIELFQGGVDAGADAYPLELRVLDRSGDDSVLLPEMGIEQVRIHTLDLDGGNPTGELGLEARVEPHAIVFQKAFGPVVT